jgi:transcriptional regulator with XRE-family HTH domain
MQTDAGKIIKEARDQRGLTQEDIAKRLGISLRQYHKYENGEFPKYKTEMIKSLDAILGTQVYGLIYEQEVRSRKVDLEELLSRSEERILRLEAHIEVYESAIAGLMSKSSEDFMKKVGELREQVKMAVNRRFDEPGRKQ